MLQLQLDNNFLEEEINFLKSKLTLVDLHVGTATESFLIATTHSTSSILTNAPGICYNLKTVRV